MKITTACGPTLLMILIFSVNEIAAQEGPGIVIAHPGQDVELLCNVTGRVPTWTVNNASYTLSELFTGQLAGHNSTGINIIVEDIMMNDDRNGSVYICLIPQAPPTPDIVIGSTTLYVAGVPAMVPNVTFGVVDNITINGRSLNCTLCWREPFNNLDPIINYTISCSGDNRCLLNFNTTDNTTRKYPLTNLTTNFTYTFSVVATNSIGSGEAGVVTITTPAIDQVTGVTLTCEPVGLANQCTVLWNRVTHENITGYQVYYNGTTESVNNSTTTLTFTAPLLPDDVFTDTVVVMVTAISSLGIGPPSIETTEITASSVTDAVILVSIDLIDNITLNSSNLTHSTISIDISMINATVVLSSDNMSDPMVMIEDNSDANEVNIIENNKTDTTIIMLHNVTSNTYNMTVISTIHPESEADMVVVTANEKNGTAPVIDNSVKTAIVKIDELKCGTAYTIMAGGIFNNQMLAGPKLNLGSTSNLLCETIENERQNDDNIGGIVGGVVGGVVVGLSGVIGTVLCVIWLKKRKKNSRQNTGDTPLTSPTSVKPSETDSKSFTKEERKPTEGPTDEYAQVSKPAKQQQPKNTEVGINYAELELQKGPKRFGNPDSTVVTYGEVTGTNQ